MKVSNLRNFIFVFLSLVYSSKELREHPVYVAEILLTGTIATRQVVAAATETDMKGADVVATTSATPETRAT